MADCVIAGGAQSMSFVPMGGWRIVPHAKVGKTKLVLGNGLNC